ncbi:hypothetical protein BHE74_00055223 [Ensete ventricosum]|nr:hypothetical protein BHE74_00055223 [Ensete ventricosum]
MAEIDYRRSIFGGTAQLRAVRIPATWRTGMYLLYQAVNIEIANLGLNFF